tara:strand:- start:7934 stop:9832 length:1899 start_codon:yes stop_codon:yes gene_type:complete
MAAMQFQGFKPQAMERIAGTLGYQGDMSKFKDFLSSDPEAQSKFNNFQNKAIQMMNGGMVRKNYQEGGTVTEEEKEEIVPDSIGQTTVNRMQGPALPIGGVATATGTVAQTSQDLATSAGQVGATSPTATATQGAVQQAMADPRTDVSTIAPVTTAGTVEGVLDQTQTPTGTVSDKAQVTGQQQTETAVSTVDAAQGTALKMDNPVQRELQAGEIIEPAANAEKASKFTEQIQAATATPSDRATVKGQLDTLMADFEGGETPAWAAGALRNATAQMAARGLGASSMAGQALVQAAMESALPIASADAQTVAGFEIKNLSNRQERAMLSAQQRATFMGMEFDQAFQSRVANAAKVSDIANMNFTAEQQVALENSRAANTMNLSNLSNRQALTMAEASSLANLDMANLSNRQSAAVMNAQSFLAMDMTNLANQQQTEMFKAQQRTQSMFTDQAADNAAKQFNATSENQSDQFFANLKTQTSQFNTTQANAMSQFNAGEENAVNKFNTEIANQRDQFNAQNGLVIAQSNAVWRREIATAATAAVNRANEINAASVLDMSNQAYSNLWQEHADMMEWAWTSSDNERDRQNAVTLSHLAAGRERSQQEYQSDVSSSSAIGDFVSKLALGYAGKVLGF